MGRRRLGPGRGGAPPCTAAIVSFQFRLSSPARFRGAAPLGHRRTLGKAASSRDRGAGGDFCRLLRRAVVAAGRGSDQSRCSDTVARGRDRGQYRPRQYGRGRRHADRAGGADPDRGAYPRHRGTRSRPRHCRQRAESRSEIIRHRAVDGAASCREPQSGGRRTRGADHARRTGDGVRGRHGKTARYRRGLQA